MSGRRAGMQRAKNIKNEGINDIVEEFRHNLEPLYMDKQSKWKNIL